MLQTEASTSAFDNNNDSEDLQPKNESSLKRRTTANRNIYRTQLVLCSLVLMAMFCCADASFKNYIKAPDELSQVSYNLPHKAKNIQITFFNLLVSN